MKTFLRTLVTLGAALLAFVAGPGVMAAQCPDTTPYQHAVGGLLSGLPEDWVSGFASRVGNPLVWSADAAFICTDSVTPGIDFCQPNAGLPESVALNGNWGNLGHGGFCSEETSLACLQDEECPFFPDESCNSCPANNTSPNGAGPIVALVTSIDDEGDPAHSGKYVILSVGWEAAGQTYKFDLAHPNYNNSEDTAGVLGAAEMPHPSVRAVVLGAATADLDLEWSAANAYDDCLYNHRGTCPNGAGVVGTIGVDRHRLGLITGYTLYSKVMPCSDGEPTSSQASAWDEGPTVPGTSALWTVPYDPSLVNCTFLALGLEVNGRASAAVSKHRRGDRLDDNCPGVPNEDQDDSDGDGVGDACDNCPFEANADQTDADGDLVGDVCDNCPGDSNQNQLDGDSDGIGDACDSCPVADSGTDGDFDGIVNECDNCPEAPNPNQLDADGDNVGDICDNCPNSADTSQVDGDGDGIGNACDNCPAVTNADQSNVDFDPFGDACDNCPTVPNPAQNADACTEGVQQAVINVILKGGIVTWNTTSEITVGGFNLVWERNGKLFYANQVMIPCTQCNNGVGDSYSFPIAKHKTSRNLWVQMIVNVPPGTPFPLYGPAVYQH